MFDLHVPTRTIDGVDLAGDDENPLAFYILPPSPAIRLIDNRSDIELLRFVENDQLTGGHLRLRTELRHSEEVLQGVRAKLMEELREDEIILRPLPLIGAAAELLFLGRETTDDGGIGKLVEQIFGHSPAQLDAPYQASFSVDLTPDGVRMIESAMHSQGAPIGIIYRLKTEGLWPAHRIVARVDWTRVYDHFSRHYKVGAFLAAADIKKIVENLVENNIVTINAVQGLIEREADPTAANDISPAMNWIQRILVEEFCEPVMELNRAPARASLGTAGEMFSVGTDFKVKKFTQIERALGEIDFQRRQIVIRTLTTQAHLAQLLVEGTADEYISDAGTDHPFFSRIEFQFQTIQQLTDLHIKEIILNFTYGTAQSAIQLTPESSSAQFQSWTDASPERTWSLVLEISFNGDAPVNAGEIVTLAPISGQSRLIMLDLVRLINLTKIDIHATTDSRVLMSMVKLHHIRGETPIAENEITLTPAAPKQQVWLDNFMTGDIIQSSVKYLLNDGRMIEHAAKKLDTQILRLPPPFPGIMTIQLISESDWSDLDQVIVALQKEEGGAIGTFTFDQPDIIKAVNLEMPDPNQRQYRYKMTRTWSDGRVEAEDWDKTDVSVLIVGRIAANILVVELTPLGPELPQAGVRLIEVELSYLDIENQIRHQYKHIIRARADSFRWKVAIADTHKLEYEYRVTVHRTSGEIQIGDWTKSSDRIIPIPIH